MNAITTPNLEFKQDELLTQLRPLLTEDTLLWEPEDTIPYECDGLAAYRQRPMAVALPQTEDQIIQILKICHQLQIPVVPRGAGTGLSGGARPISNGLVLSLAKFKKILDINPLARTATVQPGVRNLAISEAVAKHGLYYAPDPSFITLRIMGKDPGATESRLFANILISYLIMFKHSGRL